MSETQRQERQQFEEVLERALAATGGEWFSDSYSTIFSAVGPSDEMNLADADERPAANLARVFDAPDARTGEPPAGDELRSAQARANREFLEHAREDVLWLIGQLTDAVSPGGGFLEGGCTEEVGEESPRAGATPPSFPPSEPPEENAELLGAVSPRALEEHLRLAAAPWRRLHENQAPGRAAVWELEVAREDARPYLRAGTHTAPVALEPSRRDYPHRVRGAIDAIAKVEARPARDVLEQLLAPRLPHRESERESERKSGPEDAAEGAGL